MDEKGLLDALSKHLGLLAALQWWLMASAIAAIYMLVASKNELDLKLIKVTREDAGRLLGVFYLVGLAGFFITLVRIYLLVQQVPTAQVNAAFTAIATNAWLFNPNAYFGYSLRSLSLSGASLLALVLSWSLGYAALVSVSGRLKRMDPFLLTSFVFLGGLSLYAVRFIDFLLQTRIDEVDPHLSALLASFNASRIEQMKWSGAIGLLTTFGTIWLIERWKKTAWEKWNEQRNRKQRLREILKLVRQWLSRFTSMPRPGN